jgi:peptidoglycan hydrolase-like protein with peptidoglycan-binding domain
MKFFKHVLLATAATGLLAACGTSEPDRAEGGAATGAATGAAIGAVFGGVGAIPGALIGGAVGAGTGAATTPNQVNLGQPVWDQNQQSGVASSGAPAPTASAGASQPLAMAGDDVRTAQQKLQADGFYHGPIDGLYGPQTRAAVIAYQRQNNMAPSGQLDQTTLASLSGAPAGGSSLTLATGADQVRHAQQVLQAQGYYRGAIDGRFGPATRSALVAYQRHNGLKDTAQLDADTMARLNASTNAGYGSAGPNQNTGTNQ